TVTSGTETVTHTATGTSTHTETGTGTALTETVTSATETVTATYATPTVTPSASFNVDSLTITGAGPAEYHEYAVETASGVVIVRISDPAWSNEHGYHGG